MALLQSKGHEVSLFAVHNNDIRGFFQKVTTAFLTIYNPWSRRHLSAAIAEFRPEVVHVHNFFPQLSPSIFFACRDAGVPTVMTLHNFRILCPTSFLYYDARIREHSLKHSSFWTVWSRTFHRSFVGTFFVACMVDYHKWAGTWKTKVDRFIALTNSAKEKLVEGGIPRDLIVVKGNCVTRPPEAASNSDERKGALFVGRLSPEKGLNILLGAWKGIDYPLRIAGDGPLRELCESAQNEHISYLGRLDRDQVYSEMARAEFLVMPSIWSETFGLAVIEAFACGLPVIASRLGSFPDLIEESISGLLFSPIEASSLRETVHWAIAHPREMREMGERARAHYTEFHTPDVNYASLMRVYEYVIRSCHDMRRL